MIIIYFKKIYMNIYEDGGALGHYKHFFQDCLHVSKHFDLLFRR